MAVLLRDDMSISWVTKEFFSVNFDSVQLCNFCLTDKHKNQTPISDAILLYKHNILINHLSVSLFSGQNRIKNVSKDFKIICKIKKSTTTKTIICSLLEFKRLMTHQGAGAKS